LAKKAQKIAPNEGRIADTLGWALYKSGNYDDALKSFIKAAEYLPEEPNIRYHLGLAYLKKGINEKAREELERAVNIGNETHFAELEDVQRLLAEIKKR
jgi:Tfp pilus assembly protein PilF